MIPRTEAHATYCVQWALYSYRLKVWHYIHECWSRSIITSTRILLSDRENRASGCNVILAYNQSGCTSISNDAETRGCIDMHEIAIPVYSQLPRTFLRIYIHT